MTFKEICQRVIDEALQRQKGIIRYAASYAAAGMKMTDAEEIRVQALYIRSNLAGMRGPEWQEIKRELDKISKAAR